MERTGMEGQPLSETERAAKEAARETREELTRLSEEMKEHGSHLLQEQRDMVAHQVESVANALRASADSFEHDRQPALAEYSREIAERVERISDDIRSRDLESMLDRARGYASDNPAVVIGGAALVGFLFARFLKSSSAPRSEGAMLPESAHSYEPASMDGGFGDLGRR